MSRKKMWCLPSLTRSLHPFARAPHCPREVARDTLPLLPTHLLPLSPALANTATTAAPKTQTWSERSRLKVSIILITYRRAFGEALAYLLYIDLQYLLKRDFAAHGVRWLAWKAQGQPSETITFPLERRWYNTALKAFFFVPSVCPIFFIIFFFCVIHLTTFEGYFFPFFVLRLDGAEVVQWEEAIWITKGVV